MRKTKTLSIVVLTIAFLTCFLLISVVSAEDVIDSTTILFPSVISTDTVVMPGDYSATNLRVTNFATLRFSSDPSASGFKGVSIHAQNIQVDSGSRISADGMGYIVGPGTRNYFGGSGYGGTGGFGWGYSCPDGCGEGGPTYGSALQPLELGSGINSQPYEDADRGGGAIRLVVSDSLTVDGAISTNGTHYHGNGGSGGSIYITAGHLAGSGSMFADGGPGLAPDNYNGWGSGGGGRIAVYYGTSTFTGTAEAKGGPALSSYWGTTGAAEDGTVVFIDTTNHILYPGHSFRFQENDGPTFTYTSIILDHSTTTVSGTVTIAADSLQVRDGSTLNINTSGSSALNVKTLTIDGDSTVIFGNNIAPVITSETVLTNNALITSVPEQKIMLTTPSLSIDATSRISADGTGYNIGPGTSSGSFWTAGSSYGGVGGGSDAPAYGSALQPTDFGSGINTNPIDDADRGGGAIELTISDLLTMNGIISANGTGVHGIGGSGGSIYIKTHQLTGSGAIRANGADSIGYYYGYTYGSGGGGRVAIYHDSSAFTGSTEAKGGTAGMAGEDGTVVFIDKTQNIMYPGHSFRFQGNDGPFSYSSIILDHSYTTVSGTVTIAADSLQVRDGFTLNINTSGSSALNVKTLAIDGGSTVIFGNNVAPVITSETVLTNNALITSVPEQKIMFTTPSLSIDATSRISADGTGYNIGPGTSSGNYWTSGSSYGGVGGGSDAPTYGSALQPTDFGSGINTNPIDDADWGGGAIELTISDLLTMDGIISANGTGVHGIGGSGGSIYIKTHQLTGSGAIRANGANSIGYSYGYTYGSGGGGRVAIYYDSSAFTGSTEAKGGTAGIVGEDGTVFWRDLSVPQPVADFEGTPTSGPAPMTVQFTDKSSGTPTKWAWDFGDGGTSLEPSPLHTYQNPGSYNIQLTITGNGGSDTTTRNSYIKTGKTITTTTGVDITLFSSPGTTITNAGAVANPSPVDMPADVQWSLGFIEFTITDVTIGGSTDVNLNLPGGTMVNTYWKYGKTPDVTTPHWYEFLYDGQTGAEIKGNVITLHFIDGKRGDDDITSNGIIYDPSGPGIRANTPPVPTPEFPSTLLPATMIIGFLGAVLLIQRNRGH